jgi:hypothetical protein
MMFSKARVETHSQVWDLIHLAEWKMSIAAGRWHGIHMLHADDHAGGPRARCELLSISTL